MEKVLTGAWYDSRTLGIKLPKRKNRSHTKKFGNEDAWNFSTSCAASRQWSGFPVSQGRLSKCRPTPTATLGNAT